MGTPKNPDGFRSWTSNRGDVPERPGDAAPAKRAGCGGSAALILVAGAAILELTRSLASWLGATGA